MKVWGYLKQLEKNGTWDVARKGKHRKPGSASRDPDQGRTHQRKERTEAPRPRPRRQAPGKPNGTFHLSPSGCRFLGRSPFFNARFWGRLPTRVNLQPVYTLGGISNQRFLCLPQTRGLAHRWLNVDHHKPDDCVLASNQRSCTSLAQRRSPQTNGSCACLKPEVLHIICPTGLRESSVRPESDTVNEKVLQGIGLVIAQCP